MYIHTMSCFQRKLIHNLKRIVFQKKKTIHYEDFAAIQLAPTHGRQLYRTIRFLRLNYY